MITLELLAPNFQPPPFTPTNLRIFKMSLPKYSTVTTPTGEVDVYRAPNDHNANPRYVVHFGAVPFRERYLLETFMEYLYAHKRHAKAAFFGRDYKGRQFGGGIVFQSYSVAEDVRNAIAKGAAL